jgi:hypothetical protein
MTSTADASPDSGEPLATLISSLRDGTCFDHPTGEITVLQTHISYVLLTGTYAYKIKKPVKLAFLDFSTLAMRKHYCEEELRINRRLAPKLYLDVVPITGAAQAPRVNGEGTAIEYAVKMLEFPDADRLDRVAQRNELGESQIRELALSIAAFHDSIAVADRSTTFANSERLRRDVMENFDTLCSQPLPGPVASLLDAIRAWSSRTLVDLGGQFRERKRAGKVRECHGDMHLANMAMLDGRIVIFDALEFNENLRWIDVQSELAFLAMDLEYRGLARLGWLLVSAYLEATGDYAGLRVFRHYKVYRAMVRAKVAGLRARQCTSGTPTADEASADVVAHIRLAHDCLLSSERPPLITHGLSGSGKSHLCAMLLQVLGAVCVRSDMERQRLVGAGKIGAAELYSAVGIDRTYRALAVHARTIVECGYPAIVDATFLKRRHRKRFLELARELGAPFVILRLNAPMEILEARVARRQAEAKDASEATVDVLRAQREAVDELNDVEREAALEVSSSGEPDVNAIARRILRGRPAPWRRRLAEPVRDQH